MQSLVGQGVALPPQLEDAVGELCVPLCVLRNETDYYLATQTVFFSSSSLMNRTRAPAADMPNVAAFLGGMVAQEAIKIITRQYVPIAGYCVVDLVDSWTGIVGGA